ncbi:MAG: (2Fe-2S)-binding protein [Deltaproteobacteria bacterium]|nr:(2Fe-2S)-binding protein [Deltaproteobacteria bacterium]
MTRRTVSMTINGHEYRGTVEPRRLLVDFIREDLDLAGTHVGCEHGVCGACTILWNGEAVRSCIIFAVQADGATLETVEGLAKSNSELHPIQQAFWENHALQCGFCTPGLLLTIKALLKENPSPTEEEIRRTISGNLCRCTGYQNIVTAVKRVAEELNETNCSIK